MLTGCTGAGTPSPDGSPDGAASAGTGLGEAGPGETGSGETGSGNGAGDGGLTYLPWGPDDPPVPTEYAVLAASPGRTPRCEGAPEAQPGVEFWALAGAVCGAITVGGSWPTATSVPAPPATDSPFQACLNLELAEFLTRALQWHEEHPGERPTVSYSDASTRSLCQDRIYSVEVLDADPLDADALDADALDAIVHSSVRVAVVYASVDFEGETTISVDGERLEPDVDDGSVTAPLGRLVVQVPRAESARSVDVIVTTPRAALTASVEIPALDEPQDSPDAPDAS